MGQPSRLDVCDARHMYSQNPMTFVLILWTTKGGIIMANESLIADLLRCALQVIGRVAIPEEKVRDIVGTGKKQVAAFNWCNADLTLTEIARKTKIDQGNLSRAASRWVRQGMAFWIGEGKKARLLHVYPISEKEPAKGAKGRGRTKK